MKNRKLKSCNKPLSGFQHFSFLAFVPPMPAPFCPYCGTQCTAVGETSFRCSGCGKTVEPPSSSGGEDRWSEGPPADSANRWSAQPALGRRQHFQRVGQPGFVPAGQQERPGRIRAATGVAAGLGLGSAGDLPGVDDRRHHAGGLDPAVACPAQGRGPAGNRRVLAAAIGKGRRRVAPRGGPCHRGSGSPSRRHDVGPHPGMRAKNRTSPSPRTRYGVGGGRGGCCTGDTAWQPTRRRPRFAGWALEVLAAWAARTRAARRADRGHRRSVAEGPCAIDRCLGLFGADGAVAS